MKKRRSGSEPGRTWFASAADAEQEVENDDSRKLYS